MRHNHLIRFHGKTLGKFISKSVIGWHACTCLVSCYLHGFRKLWQMLKICKLNACKTVTCNGSVAFASLENVFYQICFSICFNKNSAVNMFLEFKNFTYFSCLSTFITYLFCIICFYRISTFSVIRHAWMFFYHWLITRNFSFILSYYSSHFI